MKSQRHKLIGGSRKSNQMPERDSARREPPVVAALSTRGTELRPVRADRYVIERAEGEGLTVHAG